MAGHLSAKYHCLGRFWVIILALLATKQLSYANPIADGISKVTNMKMMEVNFYFKQIFEDMKRLVAVAANDESRVAMSRTTSAEELMKTPRNRRSLFEDEFPFEISKTCSLTENELKQINKLLQSIGNTKVSSKTCEIEESGPSIIITRSSEHCNQLIESIIMNVNGVKNAFRCLSEMTGVVIDTRYEELKAAYETKVLHLQLQLAGVEKKFDQKFKKAIDKLLKRYHEMEKKMRETLNELHKERLAHSDVNIKLIVKYLESGQIHSAWDMFNAKSMEMSNNNTTAMVKQIIGKAFSANVQIKNVIKFTGGLKNNVDSMVHGIISVFNEAEKRQILDRDTVNLLFVTIEEAIKTCIDLEGTDSEESRLTLDEHTLDQLIVVNSKMEFLKYIHGQ
ncbi:hypothetical protein OUZ56_022916 [Daphnia magna]|uniref:Neurexin IV n=1 Tax=Daphnia magna TaxID=35525 RepID=A0ABR0AXU8_9CRUS|nr:hypothetical protein OUZ56_022916 [Daphnia magna]